jgi:hypothetical protein
MRTAPHRSQIRPATRSKSVTHRVSRLRLKLQREQQFLERWRDRLDRVVHSFEKYLSRVSRLKREIRVLEGS